MTPEEGFALWKAATLKLRRLSDSEYPEISALAGEHIARRHAVTLPQIDGSIDFRTARTPASILERQPLMQGGDK